MEKVQIIFPLTVISLEGILLISEFFEMLRFAYGNGGWKKIKTYSPNGCFMVIYHSRVRKKVT